MSVENLIFDIGMHKGEDADFYLKKGFRVIGVEANPVLSNHCAKRFQNECQSGQLTVVSKAIAEHSGSIDFYVNKRVSSGERPTGVGCYAIRDWALTAI
jgi:hypothetical protein